MVLNGEVSIHDYECAKTWRVAPRSTQRCHIIGSYNTDGIKRWGIAKGRDNGCEPQDPCRTGFVVARVQNYSTSSRLLKLSAWIPQDPCRTGLIIARIQNYNTPSRLLTLNAWISQDPCRTGLIIARIQNYNTPSRLLTLNAWISQRGNIMIAYRKTMQRRFLFTSVPDHGQVARDPWNADLWIWVCEDMACSPKTHRMLAHNWKLQYW